MPIELVGAALIAGAAWLMSGNNGNSNNSGNWNVGHGYGPHNKNQVHGGPVTTPMGQSVIGTVFGRSSYFKGVRSEQIAADIIYNQRFKHDHGPVMRGAWFSPDFNEACNYGGYIIEMSIQIPIQFWGYFHDVQRETGLKEMIKTHGGIGSTYSQYMFYHRNFYIGVYDAQKCVFLMPDGDDYFFPPNVQLFHVLDKSKNILPI